MNTVICGKCEHSVNVDDCWCVIDTKRKSRSYECKKECLQRTSESKIEPIEIEIPSSMIETAEPIADWVTAYATQGIFQQISNWFNHRSGYERVKRE
jgi:hypothetical protein